MPWVLTKVGNTGASNTSPEPDPDPDTANDCIARATIFGVNGDLAQKGEGVDVY